MLTEFFAYCRAHPDDTQDLLYIDAPEHLTWHNQRRPKCWAPRAGGRRTIGRIYFISPRSRELFYLRMLLHTVKSPKSFEHLRSYDGVQYDDFRAACMARGLLDNDEEWDHCLREASGYQSGYQFRNLFALIICNHDAVSAIDLFNRHYINSFVRRYRPAIADILWDRGTYRPASQGHLPDCDSGCYLLHGSTTNTCISRTAHAFRQPTYTISCIQRT